MVWEEAGGAEKSMEGKGNTEAAPLKHSSQKDSQEALTAPDKFDKRVLG